MWNNITTVLASIEPSHTIIIVLLLLFIWLLWIEHKKSNLDWTDMITARGTNRVSLSKVLQLVGGVTGTWIMVVGTLKATITPEWFLIYLTYVGGVEGWSKFISAKYNLAPAPSAAVAKKTETSSATPVSAKPPIDD